MSELLEHTTKSGYPTFTPAFEKAEEEGVGVGLYLTLLNNPDGEAAKIAIRRIREAVATSPDATREIAALFADYNWRPQLVGAMAVLLGTVNPVTLEALWQALDGGSWVSPQLAVTAYLCDPDFEAQARRRIEAGCPIHRERLGDLDWATRHSAAGPGSFVSHSGKALKALAFLCRRLPSAAEPDSWLERALAQDTIQQIVAKDFDSADAIVEGWLSAVASLPG